MAVVSPMGCERNVQVNKSLLAKRAYVGLNPVVFVIIIVIHVPFTWAVSFPGVSVLLRDTEGTVFCGSYYSARASLASLARVLAELKLETIRESPPFDCR